MTTRGALDRPILRTIEGLFVVDMVKPPLTDKVLVMPWQWSDILFLPVYANRRGAAVQLFSQLPGAPAGLLRRAFPSNDAGRPRIHAVSCYNWSDQY